ncbi:hypothetical protein RV03_GL003513 [Enterococcus gallinarum]|nr:hypothetical protein RV03_GL003513 [Enterococcus gallinarum]
MKFRLEQLMKIYTKYKRDFIIFYFSYVYINMLGLFFR